MSGLSHINQSALSDDAALAAEYGAELEVMRADLHATRASLELAEQELATTRESLELVAEERDELRGAITAHKNAIWREVGRPGSKMDRTLWDVLKR